MAPVSPRVVSLLLQQPTPEPSEGAPCTCVRAGQIPTEHKRQLTELLYYAYCCSNLQTYKYCELLQVYKDLSNIQPS